jgi:choline-sulfatase
MRIICFALALLVLALASCKTARKDSTGAGPKLRPINLVLVTIDTLRADRLHCYGNDRIETPTLDRIAQRGVLFEQAVAQTPLTPPSHASIFTGTYPNVHKVRNTGGFVLQASNVTLAKILQGRGWDTAAFLGSAVLKKAFGFSQGFATYDDRMPKPARGDTMHEDPDRPAEVVVSHALDWLSAQSGKPYFLWVHLFDPHLPYEPPQPFRDKYKDDLYNGEVAYADHELARLMDAVEKKSPGNTLVVVLADHGESLAEHGEYTHGIFLYDATLHIPFLIAGPGVPAGTRVKQQVRTIDVLPTVLELMGGKPPAVCQGVSLRPAFTGHAVASEVSYTETLYPKMNMGWSELRGVRTPHWKYIRAPRPELYDLTADPGEKTNVIDAHPKEFRELEAQVKTLSGAGTGDVEKVETSFMDQRSMDQLKSLGYLSGFAPKEVELNGKGADPKDRVGVLKAFEYAAGSRSHGVSLPRRMEYLKQAVAEDPSNAAVYYYLGAEYERAGRYGDAMQLYQGALAKGVRNGKLYSRVADLYLREGNKDEALSAYEKAARFNPSDFDSQANMATVYLEKGRAPEAERVFRWILENEQNAVAYNGLGLIAIGKRDFAAARAHFESAVALDADMAEAQLNLGLIYKMAGDLPRARSCFETFLAKAPRAQYRQIIPKVKEELAAMQ